MSAKPELEPSFMVQQGENLMNAVYTRVTKSTKSQLKISIGDPTFDGNLVTSKEATEALLSRVDVATNHSYQRPHGHPQACAAVAHFWAKNFAGDNAANIKEDNVVLACGGSEAILDVFTALCDEGDNVLLPAPGFAQYPYVCDAYQIEKRNYHMTSENNWEIDLDEVRALVDDKTKAILINNPSNPCGSNWSRSHVEAIIKVCEELKLAIIADEIYAGIVYEGQTFTSVASFSTEVPRFIIAGTAKSFMAPGWRLGWTIVVDEKHYVTNILAGMKNLAIMSMGPNALLQHALPDMLRNTPDSYFAKNNKEIEQNAMYFAKSVRERCPGLSCAEPQGALYLMVKVDTSRFPDYANDVEFYQALEDEENVQVVPGTYMGSPGYFRACITRPAAIIEEVMERMSAFCARHATKE
uniref:Tyrosine transaminase n=1 Tax=Strigomonas galati TaxID=1003336 RepID=T1YSU0_9TRYP|nr:tyrosine transaminase [Strigomonas galati]